MYFVALSIFMQICFYYELVIFIFRCNSSIFMQHKYTLPSESDLLVSACRIILSGNGYLEPIWRFGFFKGKGLKCRNYLSHYLVVFKAYQPSQQYCNRRKQIFLLCQEFEMKIGVFLSW